MKRRHNRTQMNIDMCEPLLTEVLILYSGLYMTLHDNLWTDETREIVEKDIHINI